MKSAPPDEKARADNAGHFAESNYTARLLSQPGESNIPAPHLRTKRLRLRVEHWAANLVQRPFGYVFWLLEQRKGKLHDRLANMKRGEP